MKILHKVAFYTVLTFVFAGGSLTVIGPNQSDEKATAGVQPIREWPSTRELTATKVEETPQTAVKAVAAEPGI